MFAPIRNINIFADGNEKPQSINLSGLSRVGWYPRAESNRQLCFRRALLYPFNYGDISSFAGSCGEMDRLERALLKHTIKSTVHTSESEYRGSRVYPKSVISLINRGSLIHLTTETYQSAQGRDVSYVNILPQKRQKE